MQEINEPIREVDKIDPNNFKYVIEEQYVFEVEDFIEIKGYRDVED